MECLVDATPEDLTEAIPFEWKDTKTTELPQVGEKEHSWIVLDKHILLKHPLDYWAENQLENKIPMVFGKIFYSLFVLLNLNPFFRTYYPAMVKSQRAAKNLWTGLTTTNLRHVLKEN